MVVEPIPKPPTGTGTSSGVTATAPVGPILRTEKLVKVYGGRPVVNGVDIELKRGEIVGLLGPNGAGKPPRST